MARGHIEQVLGPGERRLILLAGMLQIAQEPAAMGHIEEAIPAGVDAVEEERAAMRLGVIQDEPLLRMREGAPTLPLPA